MKNYKSAGESNFYCVICGNKGIPILRKSGSAREAGHLKKLYCLNCKTETNHAECKPFTKYDYKDFIFEKENGNFTKEGNRVMSYGDFRSKMNAEGVELP